MDIYNYDKDTGEYLGMGQADESPLEPGNFLIPAYATPVEPPASVSGYARCLIDGAWAQIEDHRGITVYDMADGSSLGIETLGSIPNGYTVLPPCEHPKWDGSQWVADKAVALSAKLSALAAYRYAKETGGITVSGATIKTDRESQALIAGAKLYSDLNEAVLIDWKAENSWVQINRTAIVAISQAVAAHVQACFSQERVHAEAINALTTAAEIEAYDFTTGWPDNPAETIAR